jgi:hypothetical protein
MAEPIRNLFDGPSDQILSAVRVLTSEVESMRTDIKTIGTDVATQKGIVSQVTRLQRLIVALIVVIALIGGSQTYTQCGGQGNSIDGRRVQSTTVGEVPVP